MLKCDSWQCAVTNYNLLIVQTYILLPSYSFVSSFPPSPLLLSLVYVWSTSTFALTRPALQSVQRSAIPPPSLAPTSQRSLVFAYPAPAAPETDLKRSPPQRPRSRRRAGVVVSTAAANMIASMGYHPAGLDRRADRPSALGVSL